MVLCVCVSVSVWYVYAYAHVGVPTLMYVCVYVCIISMGAVSKKCCLFDEHILAPRKLPRSFSKHLSAENPPCVDTCMYTLQCAGHRCASQIRGSESWDAVAGRRDMACTPNPSVQMEKHTIKS